MHPLRNKHGEKLDHTYHEGSRDDCLVILGHGVTGNKDRPLLVAVANHLAQEGWPCLRISFSGNGDSEGSFTDSNISKEVDDLTAVLDQWAPGKRVAYIGHSMGGAVGALTVARDERLRVLVSLAGMVHTKEFAEREFGDVAPDEGCMWDEPDCPLSQSYMDDLSSIEHTTNAISGVRTPWLLLHGTEDDVVFPADSEDLHSALKGVREIHHIDGAGHSFEGYEDQICPLIANWLEKHL